MKRIIGEQEVLEFPLLGKGNFSKVYKCWKIDNPNQLFAMKEIPINWERDYAKQKIFLERELTILKNAKSENIVHQVTDFSRESNEVFQIVLEYCDSGDLNTQIKKKERIPEQECLLQFSDILNGQNSLAINSILHRDIKAANILLSKNSNLGRLVAKLADFGLSKIVEDVNQLAPHSRVGTPITTAPEILNREDYEQKADVWSLGILFFYMLHGYQPFKDENNDVESFKEQIKKKPVAFNENFQISQDIKQIILKMLTYNKNDRPDFPAVLGMFKDINSKINKKEIVDFENELLFQINSIGVVKKAKNYLLSLNLPVSKVKARHSLANLYVSKLNDLKNYIIYKKYAEIPCFFSWLEIIKKEVDIFSKEKQVELVNQIERLILEEKNSWNQEEIKTESITECLMNLEAFNQQLDFMVNELQNGYEEFKEKEILSLIQLKICHFYQEPYIYCKKLNVFNLPGFYAEQEGKTKLELISFLKSIK